MAIKMEDKVEVSMTVGEWNRVIDMLGDHPFKQSAPIIGQITQQVQAIISASTASTPASTPPDFAAGNGSIRQEEERRL